MVQGGIFFITASKTMKDKKFYAHFRDGKSPEDWHRLEDHLKAVAEMDQRFAKEFEWEWESWF